MPPAPEEPREFLSGNVERVTFHNPETGYCVLRLKARGHKDLVTVTGSAASVTPGEFIQAGGQWEIHRQHGQQFKALYIRATPPTTLEGITKYLGSGMIRYVGPKMAARLVKAFGEGVLEVIEREPDRLATVPGIGPKRAENICRSWADQMAIREIMLFLQSHGVSTARAVRIYKTYGANAIATVTDNPYHLARDIHGIGFATADEIALKLGVARDSPLRARAGISHALQEAVAQGHCGLPVDDLLALAERLLDIPRGILHDALAAETRDGVVVRDAVDGRDCIFLARLWQAEQEIAQRMRALAAGQATWADIDADQALEWVEGTRLRMTLAPSQREAVRVALRSKAMVITGGPGVGKTTLVRSILEILRRRGVNVALCAPTGRAAKRLSESTGLDAKTIHRLLEAEGKGRFKRGEENPISCDLLVVDETSMVDVPMMAALLRALPGRAGLLLVGDVDQLPSVGPGQVLRDVIASEVVPVARLTEIHRQASSSRIIVNAHRVNGGLMPELDPPPAGAATDFYFVGSESPEDSLRQIIRMVCERVPARFGFDPVRDVQILCPMNRGSLGTRTLNIELQRVLNGHDGPSVERFGWTFRVGDKVMQMANDYDKDVFNGDLGFVQAIDEEDGEIAVDFDGRLVVYELGELDQLVLAYATTIHKSQGSEYPVVIIPVSTQHYTMLRRNLLYTGITRGRKLVILVGQKKALHMAVVAGEERPRWSKLRERLREPEPDVFCLQ